MLIQAVTQAASSAVKLDSAMAASAPDLLALTRTIEPPSQPASRIARTITAALSSTESLSPDSTRRLRTPSVRRIRRWFAKSEPFSGWLL